CGVRQSPFSAAYAARISCTSLQLSSTSTGITLDFPMGQRTSCVPSPQAVRVQLMSPSPHLPSREK
ncbi:hypothetical protein GOODEAATRI_034377, partial [Goodea atripinnis]